MGICRVRAASRLRNLSSAPELTRACYGEIGREISVTHTSTVLANVVVQNQYLQVVNIIQNTFWIGPWLETLGNILSSCSRQLPLLGLS